MSKMIKILITGANSYIGTSFEKYMAQWSDLYFIDAIDGSWIKKDFSFYDVVFHVAGIAHSDNGRITETQKNKYYSVNTDLTEKTALKAKRIVNNERGPFMPQNADYINTSEMVN